MFTKCAFYCFYGYKSGRTWVETQTFIEGKRMKFKNKIIISFCIIIFVPIFLATLVLFSMQHIQMRAIEQTYGVEGDGYSYFSNSVQLLSRFTREIYREVYKVADSLSRCPAAERSGPGVEGTGRPGHCQPAAHRQRPVSLVG